MKRRLKTIDQVFLQLKKLSLLCTINDVQNANPGFIVALAVFQISAMVFQILDSFLTEAALLGAVLEPPQE